MANDMEITGVAIGPVILARATERRPPTRSDKRWNWASWFIAALLITSVSPLIGLILVFGIAVIYAAATAPTPDGRNTP